MNFIHPKFVFYYLIGLLIESTKEQRKVHLYAGT
jgi:hypothetical protein